MTKKNIEFFEGKTYLDPSYDPAFYALLGEEETLKDFLNSILHLDEANSIKSLEFTSNQSLTFRTPEAKEIKFDIHAWTKDNRCLDIEIQRASHKFFQDRIIMYSAYLAIRGKVKMDNSPEVLALDALQQKLRRYEMPEAISIWLCNFPLKLTSGYKDSWHLYSDNEVKADNAQPVSTKMNYILVDLKEFAKTNVKVENKEDQWLYLLANAGNAKDLALVNDPVIRKALDRIEVDSASEELLLSQKQSMISQDEIDARIAEGELNGLERGTELGIQRGIKQGIEQGIKQGVKQGIEQGIAQGIEQGLEQGLEQGANAKAREIAVKAKEKGLSLAVIASISGLSEEEIQAL